MFGFAPRRAGRAARHLGASRFAHAPLAAHTHVGSSRTVTEQVTAVWLTQEDFARLQDELRQLTEEGRPEVVARIESARAEGDLRENGGYHAAKDEQGKMEARIRQLTELLRTAQVGAAPDTGGKAAAGTFVTVRFAGDTEQETFLLGSREGTGHDYQVYSPQSPLGEAITGHGAGDTVQYTTPTGAQLQVEIIDVRPYTG
jgi:transcription elongation factor GreA